VIAAEYMPMVQQFGLAEEYDRLQITRLLPFLSFWPEENLALQVTVESLIRPRFQRWLRDTLMQSEKSQRRRIIFELAEADVCQYIGRLQPVMRLVNALGIRVAVVQAGLTLVGTSWIKQLDVEVIKLHQGCRAISKSAVRTSCWFRAWWRPVRACRSRFLQPAFAVAVSGRCCLNAVSRVVRGIFCRLTAT
jgi:EAL domain-containing protein (putative c-di-GMP-specific phosphodiesterase class I)